MDNDNFRAFEDLGFWQKLKDLTIEVSKMISWYIRKLKD